ncbi:MAG TPA: UDP-3-O-(3-hydroxymyristoyl)glucosamine N-acyltransferase [Myxococcota bacterium]|nr:UDP-3-O-(3-hydroxymyristoyl)glucosamine N-acyltransferase [Myxococcota bacterium]
MAPPRIRLSDLADALGLGVEGDAGVWIDGVAPLDVAGASDLSFVRSPAYAEKLPASRAGAVVALRGIDVGGRPALRSDDPSRDFYRAAKLLVPEPAPPPGVHASAVVAPGAQIDPSASIGPGCAVGAGASVGARSVLHAGVILYPGVVIGADCVLHARCVIAAASVLGERVWLHPGVVIGGEGFGYVGAQGGGLERAHHVGRVVVEDDVEIGANSTVDRGTLGDTRIGRGTKIDNLVQIGHNCRIGERVVIVAQAGLAGSTTVGDDSVILAQAGVAGHLEIGARALVGPQCGVHKDVPAGGRVLGSPQRAELRYHREVAALGRLPELLRRVRVLERRIFGGRGDA